jgi:hypothetical protein
LYTRRIGQTPSINLAANESIEDYPSTIKLINALKISGRTKSGLGIGVLNAVSEKTSAKVTNNDTGDSRLETISPLTNYNVFVLDQRFNKNSSVSLVNTNVSRNGEYRDANVSALVWDLNTKKNTYNLSGSVKYSYVNNPINIEDKKGISSNINLGETSGKYRYSIGGVYASKDYDNNDLGINFQTHYHGFYANSSYRILNPTEKLNTFQLFLNTYSEFDNTTGKIQQGNIKLNVNITDKKNDYFGFGGTMMPLKINDFYEPRAFEEKRYVVIPENFYSYFYFSHNYNRRFALDINPSATFFNEKDRISYGITFSPRYRYNDHLSFVYKFTYK